MPYKQEEANIIIQMRDKGGSHQAGRYRGDETGQILGCFDGRICYLGWI